MSKDIAKILEELYSPKPNDILENYQFHLINKKVKGIIYLTPIGSDV